MFIFKNGCTFEQNGVEITVPANFGIDGDPVDFAEEWLTFMPPDKGYRVRYEMNYDSMGTKEELYDLIYDKFEPDRILPPIEEIEHNGLTGHQTTYCSINWQTYEARFMVEKTKKGSIEFVVSFSTFNHDIERIKASPEFKQVFQGIRRI